ncbi:sphingoid long-chain bases kinase 2, mitochondrial-like [Dorcoceras hygrometricum]|uniref:Sphingoid long-chain bases kinase 2, mitochondrial-like n=1 Tax=Dorcoceras hygrometricum TaxID=472368 RepID=A0A2Z7D608_9LAMI|nr:sphingoid long-chain bases kinase 2, mitochondrial-like [Dorcoceras hygrometricum]
MCLPSYTPDVTFDLQDVCIAIGSIATLDLPMVVDLIGIYGLKGPYCTLTTTDWFSQALSVIPRGSWGDVARRFTMIRWASPEFTKIAAASLSQTRRRRRRRSSPEICFRPVRRGESVRADLVSASSAACEGVSDLVVDRIGITSPVGFVEEMHKLGNAEKATATKAIIGGYALQICRCCSSSSEAKKDDSWKSRFLCQDIHVHPHCVVGKSSRKIFTTNDWTTSCKYNHTQAIAHPVVSYNEPAVAMNPVDMESSRKKSDEVESCNPVAR